ncbi:4'-phosphopantetheinyl transferase superfamily protein [Nonomuraea sp. NPDC046570]|uniref:4'-phosphopantetheinyl transferase family protein n=1 Tax=Nonomuraea sp. NPDC046570 TaxID=3155255 RepID=UPI0033E48396
MSDPLVMAGSVADVAGDERWLTPVERERAARFRRDSDRRAFVAAHLLVRHCAAAYLDLPPDRVTLLQHCEVHGPGHGRPYLEQAPELGVSLSHSRDHVCAAVGAGRVGVDCEQIPEGPLDEGLAAQVLAPRERAWVRDNADLIRLWTRKEALIKRGELTLDRLREMDLSPLDPHDTPPPAPDPHDTAPPTPDPHDTTPTGQGPREAAPSGPGSQRTDPAGRQNPHERAASRARAWFTPHGWHLLEWRTEGGVVVSIVTDGPPRYLPIPRLS